MPFSGLELKLAKIVLPTQQWAISENEIKPFGCDALKMFGPSERSWGGIRACFDGNHKPWPAFYTSTKTESGYSQWVEFGLGMRQYQRWFWNELYVFDLEMEAHEVYIVNEHDDYEALADEYFTRDGDLHAQSVFFKDPKYQPGKTFDWVQMALDGIDCVWVKNPYCHKLLHYMDVEQCIWLHMPKFEVVNRVVVPSASPDW